MLVEVEGPDVTVAAVREAIELSTRKYCSVGAMLAAGETAIHHRYRVIGTGADPSTSRARSRSAARSHAPGGALRHSVERLGSAALTAC